MSESITLELPEEIAERARETAARTGRSLEVVLTYWLERGAAAETVAPLVPNVEYPIFTPFGNEAAAQILFDVSTLGKQNIFLP